MKLALLLLLFQLYSPRVDVLEIQKYIEIDEILTKSYNHSRQLSADQEAEAMARTLLEKYPDDPYAYHLWASMEWLLIGRELNLKADEQKDITKLDKYKERAKRYRNLVDKGLLLTENAQDEKLLFLRAALQSDHAKFTARYDGGGIFRFRQADKEAAEGIRILKKILENNPGFCSAYLFLGANRLQLSTKLNLAQQLLAWKGSRIYNELYTIDSNVVDEKKSIEWLEISYACHYFQPWMKKGWLEANFLLIGAYQGYGNRLNVRDQIPILKKEIPILRRLSAIFPQNQDVADMLSSRELRLKTLENYFNKR